MPELTRNLGLKKPLLDEAADITVINENMDKIDEAIGIYGSGQAIHHATVCTGTGESYELVVPTLDYPLPDKFVLTFIPHVSVLDNAVVVIRKSVETPEDQSTIIPIVTNENEAISADAFAATTMVMLTVGGGRAFFKMGGTGKPPENWQHFATITETSEWTVPFSGWYKFHIIGPGGKGGGGASAVNYSGEKDVNRGGGGGGGAGGGLAISIVRLKMGDKIPAVISATMSSFGKYGTALAGANGKSGSVGKTNAYPSHGDPGAGGTPGGSASGGNVINVMGNNGETNTSSSKYLGAKGSPPLEQTSYYSPQAGAEEPGVTISNGKNTFGGGGGGGKGSTSVDYPNSTQGKIGAPGGIVIEIEAVES